MEDFGIPLLEVRLGFVGAVGSSTTYFVHNILKGIWAVNGKADKEKVSLWVGEWTEAIVFLLPGGVPQSKLNSLSCCWVNCVCYIVLEHGRNVFLIPREQVTMSE